MENSIQTLVKTFDKKSFTSPFKGKPIAIRIRTLELFLS